MTEQHTRDIPAPKYKVLDTVEQDGRTRWHVKLGQPHIARLLDTKQGTKSSFVEVEYVHVISQSQRIEDKDGGFQYNETAVTVSDDEGAEHMGYLYFAHRALALDEALFAVGEV